MNSGPQHSGHGLDKEIAAYNKQKTQLEQAHYGQWAVFYDSKLQGTFPDFDAAAQDAIKRFGRGPYLIRQIGEGPLVLPASVVYSSFTHAN